MKLVLRLDVTEYGQRDVLLTFAELLSWITCGMGVGLLLHYL